ncbi:hypothetical protein AB4584_17630 [Vibrio splendidus]
MQKRTITAHQLTIGMTIRCPLGGDEITVSDLVAVSEKSIGIGCEKGYASFGVNNEFELVKSYDLTKCNPNWIREQLEEERETADWYRRLDSRENQREG